MDNLLSPFNHRRRWSFQPEGVVWKETWTCVIPILEMAEHSVDWNIQMKEGSSRT